MWWPTLNASDIKETYGEKVDDLTLSNDEGSELFGRCIGSESAKVQVLQ